MQFTYFDLEMAEKEKLARQILYGPATTKIQHRTESENRDWTINRSFFCSCICCKYCCASFTGLLKHVKAEQGEEEATPRSGYKNDWKKKKTVICSLDYDKSVMMEQEKRKKWNRISGKRMEKNESEKEAQLGPKIFFFFFQRSVTKGQSFAWSYFPEDSVSRTSASWFHCLSQCTAFCSPGLRLWA